MNLRVRSRRSSYSRVYNDLAIASPTGLDMETVLGHLFRPLRH